MASMQCNACWKSAVPIDVYKRQILTSMNLYNFSQDNNIEAGVLTNRKGILGSITSQDTLENDAAGYFQRVIDQSDLLFLKEPKFESAMLGLSRRYKDSVIETDKLSDFFNNKLKADTYFKKDTFISKQATKQMGFCIRTGTQISFNPKLPMCDTCLLYTSRCV